ncbi:hypothetical protein ACPPVT_16685 [Angustibacter sp. McL0619]|uniref:hypothetical protein n=1 Tax=Angustibacter sp. McL0619 TaxID=3415676 RepID=UPI003CE997E2
MHHATRSALVALVAAAACCLTACDSAQHAAESTASKAADKAAAEAKAAASSAASKAAEAAKQQARQTATNKVCDLVNGDGPLADGQVSTSDRALVKALGPVAAQAGVADKYLKPLQALGDANSTGHTTRALIAQLTKACTT